MKSRKGKATSYTKGTPIRLSADFSAETLQAKRECHDKLNVIKGKIYDQEYSTQKCFHSYFMER